MLPSLLFPSLLFFFLLFAHSGTLGGPRCDTGFPATRESCLGNDYPNADSVFSHNRTKVRDVRKDEIGAQKALDSVFTLLD